MPGSSAASDEVIREFAMLHMQSRAPNQPLTSERAVSLFEKLGVYMCLTRSVFIRDEAMGKL